MYRLRARLCDLRCQTLEYVFFQVIFGPRPGLTFDHRHAPVRRRHPQIEPTDLSAKHFSVEGQEILPGKKHERRLP